jgi:hypothetical protein
MAAPDCPNCRVAMEEEFPVDRREVGVKTAAVNEPLR